MNLFEQIIRETGNCRGTAVIDRGKTHSYPELLEEVRYFASILRENGVRPFARVGILADDSYEYIAVSLAVLSLNAAIVPLSTRASAEELETMPSKVGLNLLLCDSARRKENDTPLPLPEHFQEPFFLRNLKKDIDPIPLPDGRIPAFIRFSSGTTGANKGVVLSHESVLERTSACTGLGVRRGEHVLWVLDMAFHFVVTILLFLRKGATIVICGRPVEQGMAEALRTFPIRLLSSRSPFSRLIPSAATPRMGSPTPVRRNPADACHTSAPASCPMETGKIRFPAPKKSPKSMLAITSDCRKFNFFVIIRPSHLS